MATLSLLIFLLGAGAYALTRRFGRSVAAATAAGVAAMFLIEYSTKGTVSGTGRAIVALTILSAGISLLGVSYASLLARERQRIGDRATAAAAVAGLIFGLGVAVAFFQFAASNPKLALPGLELFVGSALAVTGGGAFAIAMATRSFGGTAGAVIVAMAVVVLREDDTGYAFAFYLMTFLPLTILTAWLGERIGRRRGARAT